MSAAARLRNFAGAQSALPLITVQNGGSIAIDATVSSIRVVGASGSSATTAATAIVAPRIIPGRRLTIVGTSETATVVITHNAGATTEGYFNGAGNVTLANYDVLTLIQMPNGVWVQEGTQNNTGA